MSEQGDPSATSAPAQGVVAIVRRGGRLLLIRRAEGIRAAGAWCFVGGAIEPGESQAAALVREFQEEMNAPIVPDRKVWEFVRPGDGLRLHWWLAELAAGDLRANPAEVAEFRWMTLPEVASQPGLLESNRAFLAAAQDLLLAWLDSDASD